MTQSDEGPGILLPERFIPTPRSISPEAQAFLANMPPVAQGPEPDDVNDKDAWRAHSAQANQGLVQFAQVLAKPYPAETVTHRLSAAPLYEIAPGNLSEENERRAILYVHGGGFIVGGGEAAIYAAMPFASLACTRTFSIDYRMAPDHPFPAGLDDTLEAYRWLLERYKPENIAFYGASAGGSLAPACILKARDLGLPMPAACVLHSPAADLTGSGDSLETNHGLDIALKGGTNKLSLLYADGHDLAAPLLSPVFGDYSKGFPPTVLTSGTRDLLLSPTVMLHRALRRAGIEAELHVWEAMSHVPFFNAPEEGELNDEQVQFMLAHMGSD